MQSLTSLMEAVFNSYVQARGEPAKGHPIGRVLRDDAHDPVSLFLKKRPFVRHFFLGRTLDKRKTALAVPLVIFDVSK